jgi:O-antigen/teichoic acid export membrane protein
VTGTRAVLNGWEATEPGGRGVAASRSPWAAAMAVWRRHHDLLGGAASLAATTGGASVLGFAYWALAARLFSQQAVGYGSAAVSAVTLLGTIGMLGLGTVLIGELPQRRPRAGLLSAALLTSGVGSLLIGLGFAVVAPHVSGRFRDMSGTPGQAALFAAGVALTGVALVFDQATIGLSRGGLQLVRNMAFAATKLMVLPVAAVILHDQLGIGITVSWVAGMALSVTIVAIRLWFTGTPVFPRPDWGVLQKLGRTAVAHSWLNLAIVVPRSLIPVLVTVIVSPSANAAFYAAWTLSGFLYVVPTHLSTVLFAVASADPRSIARKLRFTLRLSALIGLPGMAAVGLGAHLALGLFGAGYARAGTVPLWLLVIGYLPTVPKVQYVAVCRAAGRIPRAAAVLTAAGVVEVAAAAAGGAAGGLRGLSTALLAAFMVEGLVTTPPVLRAAIGSGRHRAAFEPGRHRAADPDPGQRPTHRSGAGRHPGYRPRRRPRPHSLADGVAGSAHRDDHYPGGEYQARADRGADVVRRPGRPDPRRGQSRAVPVRVQPVHAHHQVGRGTDPGPRAAERGGAQQA